MTDAVLRSRIRAAVAVLLSYYVAQTLLVAKLDEPYPGLMMPRFSWAGPEQLDGFDTKEADIVFSYADGTTRTQNLAEVLSDVPEGHRYTMMENLFSPLTATTELTPGPWGKPVPPRWLMPGYGLGRVSRREPAHRRALAEWVAGRARHVYGTAKPTGAVVLWYQAKYRSNASGDPVRVSREVAGRFDIELT